MTKSPASRVQPAWQKDHHHKNFLKRKKLLNALVLSWRSTVTNRVWTCISVAQGGLNTECVCSMQQECCRPMVWNDTRCTVLPSLGPWSSPKPSCRPKLRAGSGTEGSGHIGGRNRSLFGGSSILDRVVSNIRPRYSKWWVRSSDYFWRLRIHLRVCRVRTVRWTLADRVWAD